MTHSVQCVVIGAGVVGLAVARALALQGREVWILEAAGAIGTGTSARSSEVIHAGLYYAPGSLKARLCVQGRALLYAYCAARGIAHRRCGKLVVATSEAQHADLQALQARAHSHGVALTWLEREAARALEPALACTSALLSPETGIIDSHAFLFSLLTDAQNAGANLVLKCPVERMQLARGAIELIAQDGTLLRTQVLINAAGLAAPELARRLAGFPSAHIPQPRYAKGHYFSVAARPPFTHLIYPLPEAAGLGVHLTLDLAGRARLGPDVQWVDDPADLQVDAARAPAFYTAARRFWPGLPDGTLHPAYAGIRPKVLTPTGLSEDFMIEGPARHGIAGVVHLWGIESPGLTSALALAEEVVQQVA